MSVGHRRQRARDDPQKDARAPDSNDRQAELLEQLEEGQDISADKARQLAPQLGNAALAGLVNSGSSMGVEEEIVEEVDLALEEDVDHEVDLDTPQFGGGGAGGGDPGGDAPWAVDLQFGGEDDPSAPTSRRSSRLRRSPRRELADPDDPFDAPEADDPAAVPPEDIDAVLAALPPVPPAPPLPRTGDARYGAVLAPLTDPRQIARRHITPESLLEAQGPRDPVGRPAEIGRFLSAHAEAPRSRSLAGLLVRAIAPLTPAVGGGSGGVARLTTLAICAQAHEGGGAATDRAVALSLRWEAWPRAVQTARRLAAEGRLHAPAIRSALDPTPDEPRGERRIPPANALARRALDHLLPVRFVPDIPRARLGVPPRPSADPALDALDAAIMQYTSDRPPAAPTAVVTAEMVRPLLSAANGLLNAIGRAQVELAAAATAVTSVRPGAPVGPTLSRADQALRELARSTVRASRSLQRLTGKRLPAQAAADRATEQLKAAVAALREMRDWSFTAIAGALDV